MNNSLIKEYKSKIHSLSKINIGYFFEIPDLFSLIQNDKMSILNVDYEIKNNLIYAKKYFNFSFLEEINLLSSHFDESEMRFFNDDTTFKKPEELVLFSFFELYLILRLLEEKILSYSKFSYLLSLICYVKDEDKKKVKTLSILGTEQIRVRNERNKHLLSTNKNNYEFPRDYSRFKNKEVKNLIQEINLPLIELPFQKDIKNIKLFFQNLILLKESLNLKKFKFELRVKKIKKIKKDGLFIVNSNTIIIDPREPEAIIHEIGHYIYENGLAFNLNGKRIYKHQFQNIINKNKLILNGKEKISKYEDYDKKSEIFAYWFEKQFKD